MIFSTRPCTTVHDQTLSPSPSNSDPQTRNQTSFTVNQCQTMTPNHKMVDLKDTHFPTIRTITRQHLDPNLNFQFHSCPSQIRANQIKIPNLAHLPPIQSITPITTIFSKTCQNTTNQQSSPRYQTNWTNLNQIRPINIFQI